MTTHASPAAAEPTISHVTPTFFYADEDVVVIVTEEDATAEELALFASAEADATEDAEAAIGAPAIAAPPPEARAPEAACAVTERELAAAVRAVRRGGPSFFSLCVGVWAAGAAFAWAVSDAPIAVLVDELRRAMP